jgi:hypothetical protein
MRQLLLQWEQGQEQEKEGNDWIAQRKKDIDDIARCTERRYGRNTY